MRRFLTVLTLFACVFGLSACAANARCEHEAISAELGEADEVVCYIYESEKSYAVSGVSIADMVDGEWKKTSKPVELDKVLSVTVSSQYEYCFFADGSAMIYSGYAGVFEKDRQYYSCKINANLEDICKFIVENGTEVVEEDE